MTSDLNSLRQLQRFPETPVSSLEEQQFQYSNGTKLHAPHIISRREQILWLQLKRFANFPKSPQVEAYLSSSYVRGTLGVQAQVEWTLRSPDSKEGRISLQWLECRLTFHLTRGRDG